jgi:hypothetical protein
MGGMNRLTGDFKGASMFATVEQARIYNKLRQYEDTGLTPDEIADLRAEVERLRAAYEAPPTSLTLDDLKQMEGEPVYIQYGDGKEGWDHVEDGLPIWLESDPDFINMTCSFDKDGHFGLHVLGWQAFRRRPEAARAALEGGQQDGKDAYRKPI